MPRSFVQEDDEDEGASSAAAASTLVMDQGEVDALESARVAKEKRLAYQRRSAALRHSPALPRPLQLDDEAISPPLSRILSQVSTDFSLPLEAGGNERQSALHEIAKELALAESLQNDATLELLKSDAFSYPVSSSLSLSLSLSRVIPLF